MTRFSIGLRRITLLAISFSLVIFYIGCGGGGGGDSSSSTGVAGTWNITEHDNADTCGGEASTDTLTATITVNGSEITVITPDDEGGKNTAVGTLSGNTATFTITEDEDNGAGTSTTNLTITFSSDGDSLTGEGSWSEVFPNDPSSDCSGSFTMSGNKK